jgi:hypothetical protein
MRIKAEEKAKTYDGKEKYILRKAFDTPENPSSRRSFGKKNNFQMGGI